MTLTEILALYDQEERRELTLGDPAFKVEKAGAVVRIVKSAPILRKLGFEELARGAIRLFDAKKK